MACDLVTASPAPASAFPIDWTRPAHQRLVLLALGALLFFLGLGNRDLTSSHEARAAQNAQTILDDGHWLLPRLFDGHLELQKPPLYYWLVALLGWAGGGVGPWAVRLPAALSALGCVLFVHLLGCRRGRPRAGFLAALALATCMHFTWLARVGRIDMPLTFAVTVALGSFHLGQASGSKRWYWLGYTAVGAGTLLKGPIALVLPALVAGAAAAWRGRAAFAGRRSTLLWGVPWMLLLAAPWYVWTNLETDGRLWEVFIWYHNLQRGLGGAATLKAYPWWFYGPTALAGLFPWSLALPAIAWAWRRRPELRQDAEARLGLCWCATILVFLSCMSFKRADYLLPAYPGFALLLGCALERMGQAVPRRVGHALTAAFVLGITGATTGWAWAASRPEADWPYQRIATEIRAQTARPVIFFRAENHVLAFHLGRPVDTILEWENLAWWADRAFPVYVVMPEKEAAALPAILPAARFEEVLRTGNPIAGRREHAVVVLRSAGRAAPERIEGQSR